MLKKFKFPEFKPKRMMDMMPVYEQLKHIFNHASGEGMTKRISKYVTVSKERRRFTVTSNKPDILTIIVISYVDNTMYVEVSGGSTWANLTTMYSSCSSDSTEIDLDIFEKTFEKNKDVLEEFNDIIHDIETKFKCTGGNVT